MKTLMLSSVLALCLAAPAGAQSMPGMPGMPHGDHPHAAKPAPKPPSAKPKAKATPAQAPANSNPKDDHADHGAMSEPGAEPLGEEVVGNEPAPAPPTDFAADALFDPSQMQAARAQLRREHGGAKVSKIMLNLAEYQARKGDDGYHWESEAWFGGDIHRAVVKTKGEGGVSDGIDSAEVQLLYSRAVSAYFDLQTGVRQDIEPDARSYATIGVEGLAPYWFEVGGALFLSDKGDFLGRVETSYDLRLTQRAILQPRAEINLAAQDVPQSGIGAGITTVELGLRLRYEIERVFAPYIGVSYERKTGETADLARTAGDDPSATSLVVGVRAFY